MGIHNLADYLRKDAPNSFTGKQIDVNGIYQMESNQKVMEEKPWKKQPKYFSKTYVSSLALLKMSLHAASGGSIEIMGMMTGKIIDNAIVVMDAYPLPVEGTETRVNAQAEGYEYMVQYLEQLKKVGRLEHIVGWYHSHPGYGCWLSGIDVATQSLNQNFQDPYLAIVIDPSKTKAQGFVEIGAFRTFPENLRKTKGSGGVKTGNGGKIPKEKRQDFGAHFEEYYPLEVEVFHSQNDSNIINLLNNKSWISGIALKEEIERRDQRVNEMLKNIILKYQSEKGDRIRFMYRLEKSFAAGLQDKLRLPAGSSTREEELSLSEDEDEDMSDESELDTERDIAGENLDVSDVDDAASMESSNVAVIRNKRTDSEEDDEAETSVVSNLSSSSILGGTGFTSDLDRERRFQRRKTNEHSSHLPPHLNHLSHKSTQYNPQTIGRLKHIEQYSTTNELQLKLAKTAKHLQNLQKSGEKVGISSIEHLLTLQAQQQIFGE